MCSSRKYPYTPGRALCLTLGRTRKFIPLPWYKGGGGGGRGVDGTPPRSFWYVAVFRNDFTFSGKPFIFLKRWGRWVPVFCFTQFGGAFPCLNFSKLCGTSPLIRFVYPSIAIRYTKSTDLITEESIALITTNRTLTVCSTVSSARNCSGRLIYSMWMFLNLSLT